MRRSELNNYLSEARAFFSRQKFELPPWAFFTPEQWKQKGKDFDEIRKNRLGWDITDFGGGDFRKIGLLLFTIRNGHFQNKKGKPYAEKIMISREGQLTPTHFHRHKMEDIINRGGGDLVMSLWQADEDEGLS